MMSAGSGAQAGNTALSVRRRKCIEAEYTQRRASADSVLDGLDAKLPESLQVVLHRFELFGGVPLPIRDLAGDAQRIARAVGPGRIARVPLVGQIGVVFDRAGRFHDVDPAAPLAASQLGAPGGCIQRGGQIDVGRLLPLSVVRLIPGLEEVARLQVRFRAMVETLRIHHDWPVY